VIPCTTVRHRHTVRPTVDIGRCAERAVEDQKSSPPGSNQSRVDDQAPTTSSPTPPRPLPHPPSSSPDSGRRSSSPPSPVHRTMAIERRREDGRLIADLDVFYTMFVVTDCSVRADVTLPMTYDSRGKQAATRRACRLSRRSIRGPETVSS